MTQNIAVVGAGTMGNGIAHVFAQHNYKVSLIDISSDALTKAMETIEKNLERQVKKGTITKNNKTSALANLNTFTKISDGTHNADIAIEAATENLDIKWDIFKQLDEECPPTAILASNTSSISITQIASITNRPDKVVGMHFMNPVQMMQLVEVIKGYATGPKTFNQVMDVARHLGKTPVEINDYPGFVSNRILMPMINEAIQALFEGVAKVEEIDTVMKLGMRHPMGPLQLADFIGLDVCLSVMEVLYQGYGNPKYAPCPLLINMVKAGHLGIKSGIGFYDWSKDSQELIPARRFQ